MVIKRVPIHSSNYTVGGCVPEAVVIHIMQGSIGSCDNWFNTVRPGKESSAQEGISKSGEVHVYMNDGDTAYHAGVISNPSWPLMKKNMWGVYVNPNKYTYGIENEGVSGDMWTEPQMQALVERVRRVCDKYNIRKDRLHIISHRDITSYKENMDLWCDEIVRRLAGVTPTPPANPYKVEEAIKLLNQAIAKLKE